jgi:glycerol-3-phosphate dehydrogenase
MNAVPPRARLLRALAAPEFEVVVVGGGIVGAGVARDAARRGFRTALIERDDFAAGTSSRSSRLVHGGVRYLEHGWFHLVFEASRERRRLLDNAPHLVRPLRFTWPVYDEQRLAKWEIGAGLLIYDVLAMYRNVGKHKRLRMSDVLEREPGLRHTGLVGGATYWDATTDDSRLTLVTALDAERAGATVLNHAEVRGLTRSGGRIDGVTVYDHPSQMTIRVRARVVVNATGPWTDTLRRLEDPESPAAVMGTKGIHLMVPRNRIGNTAAITLLHPRDQRVMFVLPADAYAIVGTTDTRTTATPDEVRASTDEVTYLLEAANHYFPKASLTPRDVISAWAGIRPLIASAATDKPSNQSREHEIAVGPGGVIGVSGGKLTTYRAMAEEIVDVVADRLHRREKSDTAHALLPGGELRDVANEIMVASEICGSAAIATHLVHAYGSEWRTVWALAHETPALRQRIAHGSDAIRAEVIRAVRWEHALTLSDVLVRRTHVAFETRDHGLASAPVVAELMAPLLGWDATARDAAVVAYGRDVQRLFAVDGPAPAARRAHG